MFICLNSAIYKIWYDLDDPSGLGRRGAPDFGIEHTYLGSPNEFFTLKNASDVFMHVMELHHRYQEMSLKGILTLFDTHFW